MKARINRELKYFCENFSEIRVLLKQIGAKPKGKARQTDYYYNLPPDRDGRRLKLRVENGKQRVVYYYDSAKAKAREVEFHLFVIKDKKLKALLDVSLGQKKVVKKQREIWVKGEAIFHLDDVDGIGKIFELETEGADEKLLEGYKKMFMPYLGKEISGSNEDLVSES